MRFRAPDVIPWRISHRPRRKPESIKYLEAESFGTISPNELWPVCADGGHDWVSDWVKSAPVPSTLLQLAGTALSRRAGEAGATMKASPQAAHDHANVAVLR